MPTTLGSLQGAADFSRFEVVAAFTAKVPARTTDAKPLATLARRIELPRVTPNTLGDFRIDFPEVEIQGSVTFRVYYPNGAVATELVIEQDQLAKLTIKVPPAPTPTITPNPDPDSGKHRRLTGAVVAP